VSFEKNYIFDVLNYTITHRDIHLSIVFLIFSEIKYRIVQQFFAFFKSGSKVVSII